MSKEDTAEENTSAEEIAEAEESQEETPPILVTPTNGKVSKEDEAQKPERSIHPSVARFLRYQGLLVGIQLAKNVWVMAYNGQQARVQTPHGIVECGMLTPVVDNEEKPFITNVIPVCTIQISPDGAHVMILQRGPDGAVLSLNLRPDLIEVIWLVEKAPLEQRIVSPHGAS